MKFILIAIGGSLGAISRYFIGEYCRQLSLTALPYATFIVNFLGCFLIGIFMEFSSCHPGINPNLKLLLVTGFLGCLTTFSSFSYETIALFLHDSNLAACMNIALNLCLGLTATYLGITIVKQFYL